MCCFVFTQKTVYELRISDWSADVCSSDLLLVAGQAREPVQHRARPVLGLRREIHAHGHVAAEYLGAMPVDVLPSAEAGAVFDAFHGFLLVIRKAPLPRTGRGCTAIHARSGLASSPDAPTSATSSPPRPTRGRPL